MALIVCKHCGKKYSDTIDKCIHCGFSNQENTEHMTNEGSPLESDVQNNDPLKRDELVNFDFLPLKRQRELEIEFSRTVSFVPQAIQKYNAIDALSSLTVRLISISILMLLFSLSTSIFLLANVEMIKIGMIYCAVSFSIGIIGFILTRPFKIKQNKARKAYEKAYEQAHRKAFQQWLRKEKRIIYK